MQDALNQYGDHLIQTSGSHGADISSQRIDDLDRKSLDFVLQNCNEDIKGLDIGCGLGIQGVRFALLGAQMWLIDIIDIETRMHLIKQHLGLQNKLEYIRTDVKGIEAQNLGIYFNFIYSQRFIHYLKYQDASKLIASIASMSSNDAFLFISASGIRSELGEGYEGKNKIIQERYCKLAPKMAHKHNILEEVCLYSSEELSALLIHNDFTPIETWESSFGNIKIIAKFNNRNISNFQR